MAFKEVSGAINFVKLKEAKVGDVVAEGTYYECREGEGKYKGNYTHIFQTKDGLVGVGGKQLSYLMKFVKIGDMTRVTYNGLFKLTKGPNAGTETHQFKVAVDNDAAPEPGSTEAGFGDDDVGF